MTDHGKINSYSDGALPNHAPALQASMQASELEDVLIRNGFVRCDIAACNCGSWHARYGLPERMAELKELLADAGHPLCNANGNLISKALQELIAERDRLASTAAPQAQAPEALPMGAGQYSDADHAAWLADKIVACGDYAKEAAQMLRRWPAAPPQAPAKVLTDAQPVGSILKSHLAARPEPWCKEILLYSPNNEGDSPENRVLLYALATPTPAPEAATAPSDAKDAERWREIERRFAGTKTSQAERVVQDLSLSDDYDVCEHSLASLVDAAITAAKKGAAL